MNFDLHPEELILTNSLKQKIIDKIGRDSISVSQYMELALYEKDYGYYNNLIHKFGEAGDFITAPMVSKVFSECIAKQLKELLGHIPNNRNILEIGAGNGQMMLDLLKLLENEINCYFVLELSANLISLQKSFISEKAPHLLTKIVWLNSLPTNFDGVILANEVLDAQPCDVIVWDNGKINERVISVDSNNNLVYKEVQLQSPELLDIAKKINLNADYYTSEISLNNRGFIKSLAQSLSSGFILLIDYGHSESEYYSLAKAKGTLRGFFRHQLLDDILVYPGLIDITTSVDFTSIATTAIDNGLDFIGYTTQAGFLLNCGMMEMLNSWHQKLGDTEYLRLTSQVNYLTSPNEMGEVFKVIGFSRGIDVAHWIGFTSNDRSYTL
jgi:SAM-dependent MidA family methyltransferase